MKVSFTDLKYQADEIAAELDLAFHRVKSSGSYILGEEVHFLRKSGPVFASEKI